MRRSIVSLVGILTFCGLGLIASSAMAIDDSAPTATVSFGLWETDPPLDRFFGNPPMGGGNHHELIPNIVTITVTPQEQLDGGVNFIISGNHVVAVYDDGTQPEEINTNLLVPGITTAGGVIDDPNKRIYRGVNETAATGARDRVEVVRFSKPGTYLVICPIRNHFVNDRMYGYVVVK